MKKYKDIVMRNTSTQSPLGHSDVSLFLVFFMIMYQMCEDT